MIYGGFVWVTCKNVSLSLSRLRMCANGNPGVKGNPSGWAVLVHTLKYNPAGTTICTHRLATGFSPGLSIPTALVKSKMHSSKPLAARLTSL